MDIATLEALVDRQAITDTLQRYAKCIDAFDFDGVAGVFTDDAVAQYSKHPEMTGGAAVAQFLREHCAAMSWHQHFVTVMDIEIDGDRAAALTYFIAHMVRSEPAGELSRQVGDYRDELRRTPDGWRISRRVQQTGYRETRPAA